MLSWFRERSRSIAATALLALLTLTISSAAPHPDDCHDADCGLTLPHDPTGHSVERPQESSGQPIHCVLCHWTRSVRPTALAKISPWIRAWSFCSSTIRRVFSSSGTSSGIRFSASVFGRGEYLNENML